ncbi:APC family permease [Lactobacillus sp. DCY120]|uniref:APC family permease n=1 Tax=Bombilactobacillus apium TaxID=2675299 RepID=A0A850R5U4_9LACO|nr:amino acid permease [Bombilactobacillus apium]NVY95915.1 APC family permease [Bombilactobacillus apium]
MKKSKGKIGLFNAVMLGIGSIIGSGWLFGSWQASQVAGPAAIISWIIGTIITLVIANNYIELGAMLPENGGISKYAQYSHGSLLGHISAWANWISLIVTLPIEAVACVQYMSSWPWHWASFTHRLMSNGQVTFQGLLVVYLFIAVFSFVNYFSVKLLMRFTGLISSFKIIIPLITIIALMLSSFHVSNIGITSGKFMPYGSATIFQATTTAGIIFSLNAFQTVINIDSDLKKTEINMKRAVHISLFLSAIIYILLQIAYLTAISPNKITKVGWAGINFDSPFADLAIIIGLQWLSLILYIDAFISPFGTGVSNSASGSRALAAMADNDHLPKSIGKIDLKSGIPRNAVLVNGAVGILMVTFFRSWSMLATVISTLMLIAYLTGPVSVVYLREKAPNMERPFRNRKVNFFAPLSFALTSLAVYWAMWPTTIEVIIIILLGVPIYLYYEWKKGWKHIEEQLSGSSWMFFYLIFISLLSYIGSKEFNGIGVIKYPWDFLVVIIGSLLFYEWGINSGQITKYFKHARKLNYFKVKIPKEKKKNR